MFRRGACLCGTVTFTVSPPYPWFAHCHCSMCRKHHGALFGSGFGVRRSRFEWLTGEAAIVHYRASDAFERPFCGSCGSTVPAASHLGDVLHVPAGLIEGDPGERPRTHIFVGSKLASVAIEDSLPQYAEYPPGVSLPAVATLRPAENAALAGSCLCGSVAYASDVPPRRIVNCYCSLCRRSRAAAFGSTIATPLAAFRFSRGAEHVRSYSLPPPRGYGVDFCSLCGSLAPTVVAPFGLAFLPAGGIDTPLPPLPMTHTFVASRAPWYAIQDAWPQFAELPPPELQAELLL
jgi:hypothetical protein